LWLFGKECRLACWGLVQLQLFAEPRVRTIIFLFWDILLRTAAPGAILLRLPRDIARWIRTENPQSPVSSVLFFWSFASRSRGSKCNGSAHYFTQIMLEYIMEASGSFLRQELSHPYLLSMECIVKNAVFRPWTTETGHL
jgi:hypothetical protein